MSGQGIGRGDRTGMQSKWGPKLHFQAQKLYKQWGQQALGRPIIGQGAHWPVGDKAALTDKGLLGPLQHLGGLVQGQLCPAGHSLAGLAEVVQGVGTRPLEHQSKGSHQQEHPALPWEELEMPLTPGTLSPAIPTQ